MIVSYRNAPDLAFDSNRDTVIACSFGYGDSIFFTQPLLCCLDDDCSIFQGNYCDCDPEIELEDEASGRLLLSGAHP